MSNNSKSLIVKANGQNFEVTVKPVKASEIVTGEGEGSAAPRPANNGRRNNGPKALEASGSEANESGAGNAPAQNNQSWMANAAAALGGPATNNGNWMAKEAAASRAREAAGTSGGRRNKRKGTRRNKRKGTRRNKRN